MAMAAMVRALVHILVWVPGLACHWAAGNGRQLQMLLTKIALNLQVSFHATKNTSNYRQYSWS